MDVIATNPRRRRAEQRATPILCAGDLFDDPTPSADFWEGLAKTFRDHPGPHVPIFLVPGNHDPLTLRVGVGAEPPVSSRGFRTGCTSSTAMISSYELSPDAVLYARPVPLESRGERSRDGAAGARRRRRRLRIGCVHGCTFDIKGYQTNFPISRDAGVQRGLDYLAIGDTHSFRDVTESLPVPTVYPGAPEPTNFDEPGAGQVALVALFRHGIAAARRRGAGRLLAMARRALPRHEPAAHPADQPETSSATSCGCSLDMAVSLSEENEVERILRDLQGTEATHGRAGILLVDRAHLRLQVGSANVFPDDLPPVLKDTIARLDQIIEDAEDEAEKLRRRVRSRTSTSCCNAEDLPEQHDEDPPAAREGLRGDPRSRHRFRPGLERPLRSERSREVDAGGRHPTRAAAAAHVHAPIRTCHGPGPDPLVELTFETEAQRIWRVRKQFRKGGSSLLQESKNGEDFDDVERARRVDAKLREILRWGIPEPGGGAGSRACRRASSRRLCYRRKRT